MARSEDLKKKEFHFDYVFFTSKLWSVRFSDKIVVLEMHYSIIPNIQNVNVSVSVSVFPEQINATCNSYKF